MTVAIKTAVYAEGAVVVWDSETCQSAHRSGLRCC